MADVEAPGGEKWERLKSGGKQWQATPKELAQDAAYQSHTSRLTELWSLPRPAQGLNTNNNNNISLIPSPHLSKKQMFWSVAYRQPLDPMSRFHDYFLLHDDRSFQNKVNF